MAPLTPGHSSGVRPLPSRAASMASLWETWNQLRCSAWTKSLSCTMLIMHWSGSPWATRSGISMVRSWRLFLSSCFGLCTLPSWSATYNILTKDGRFWLILSWYHMNWYCNCKISLKCTLNSQEGSQRRTHVSLEDTAVTPTLCADLEREISSPACVLLASMVMDAHVMVRMTHDFTREKKDLCLHCLWQCGFSPLMYFLLSSQSTSFHICLEPTFDQPRLCRAFLPGELGNLTN